MEDGFELPFIPADVVQAGGNGACFPFTREFRHPADRPASADAKRRFEEDNARFPVPAYERGSLAWRQAAWRPFEPSERAQMLGVPPCAVRARSISSQGH